MDQNDLDATLEVATSGGTVIWATCSVQTSRKSPPFFGFETFPEGLYDWTLVDAGIKTLDTKTGRWPS